MSRAQTGKTPVTTILWRFFWFTSILILAMYLVTGFFWLPSPGETYTDYNLGELRQTWWTYFWDVAYTCAWIYAAAFGTLAFLAIGHTIVVNWLFRDDPAHQAWRAGGGSTFFDALEWPFNDDPDEVRNAIPPQPPPSANCPNCGGALSAWHGYQCGSCGLYWDGQQWCWPQRADGHTTCELCGGPINLFLEAGVRDGCMRCGQCGAWWSVEQSRWMPPS